MGLGTWGLGDVGTWGRGDSGTWGRGDSGTWGRGDVGTWGRGDVGTRGRGDSGTRGLGDVGTHFYHLFNFSSFFTKSSSVDHFLHPNLFILKIMHFTRSCLSRHIS